MSQSFRCGDPEALVSYLYQEDSLSERRAAQAHLATCQACASEIEALGGAREHLRDWEPPAESLEFQVTRRPTSGGVAGAIPASAVPWWRQPMPAWMQAAAAVLVFGAGLAVGTRQGAVAPGASAAPPVARATGAAVPGPASQASSAVSADELARLEARLRQEIAQVRSAQAAAAPAAVARQAAPDDALLRRMQALIGESEERQRRELALRTAQVVRDIDAQRRDDLARVQQTMGQIEGSTGAELRQQNRELWNFLMNNVSQRGTVR